MTPILLPSKPWVLSCPSVTRARKSKLLPWPVPFYKAEVDDVVMIYSPPPLLTNRHLTVYNLSLT